MSARFDGQGAIVTGGASGIGFATAARLAREGARVAIWDRNADGANAAAERIGGEAFAVDLTDWPQVEDVTRRTGEALGRIDILVSSAGITGPTVPVAEFPVDGFKQVFEVNMYGVFHACRAVLPHMTERNYGRIVNIASIAGKEGNPNASAYSASKAAVIGFTKSLGKELAQTGITVNAVTPAAVRTAIFEQMPQSHIDFMLSKIPMGRFGTVEEMASMICWLACEECAFTTGAVFDASGGRATY